jgi:hypothetical protein
VLGYKKSCWRANINVGVVRGGTKQGIVEQGKVDRGKVPCNVWG